jgi:hypothetical protein
MNTSTDKQTLTPLNTETALPIMGTNMQAIALHKLFYMIIIAMLVTLIFSSEALVIWAEKLPFNPFTETLLGAVQWWHDLMEKNGLTIVFNKLREAFRFFQSL